MKNSREMLKEENIIPLLQLGVELEGGGNKSTGPHKVKLLGDEIVQGKSYSGSDEEKMRFYVEEDGMKKKYDAPLRNQNGELHYLVQRLAEFNEGDEVVLEYIKKGKKGFINVSVPDEVPVIDKEDIPVIKEEVPVGEPPENLPKED